MMTAAAATRRLYGGMIVVIIVLNALFFSRLSTGGDVGTRAQVQQQQSSSSRRTTAIGTSSSTREAQLCAQLLDEQDALWDTRRRARQLSRHESNGIREFFDLYEPEALCFSDERFGARHNGGAAESDGTIGGGRYQAFGDGPKFVCGVDLLAARNGDCLVYSVGSSNHIDFEVSVKTLLGCEVHTFDPTLSRPFVGDEYSTFHPWGLGVDGKEETFRKKTFTSRSLMSIYDELGHTGRKIDILKIDCESCEWTTVPPIFAAIAAGDLQVDQIQIELHNYGDVSGEALSTFFAAADAAHMRIFHKERNQWGCQGFKCLEYSFVSESFLREANGRTICPASSS